VIVIRQSVEEDFATILTIINDAAHVYRGVIPADRWHEPYMSTDDLKGEIANDVFWVAENDGRLSGVMGIQDKGEVALVRHAYAQVYRGVIPADRWHEPYMSTDDLKGEIANDVVFWVAENDGRLSGVMGIQDKGEVALVRHAYVVPTTQRSGIGTHLLHHVTRLVDKPILIGTWAAASWAIQFYARNGFSVVPSEDKDRLLTRYWSIPARQVETSVVLADGRYSEVRALLESTEPV